jgi:hypothetical protein
MSERSRKISARRNEGGGAEHLTAERRRALCRILSLLVTRQVPARRKEVPHDAS